jgi:hypothetical protein
MSGLQLICENKQCSVGRKVDWGDTLNYEKDPKINGLKLKVYRYH